MYGNNFRKMLAEQNAEKRAEEEALKPKKMNPEEQAAFNRATTERICNSLTRTKCPPGYAKAAYKGRKRAVAFANETLALLDDQERVDRFAESALIFQDLVDDLNGANWGAQGGVPMVMFPVSEFAAVRGEDFTAPPDSEHWPLDQREGPITWEED